MDKPQKPRREVRFEGATPAAPAAPDPRASRGSQGPHAASDPRGISFDPPLDLSNERRPQGSLIFEWDKPSNCPPLGCQQH